MREETEIPSIGTSNQEPFHRIDEQMLGGKTGEPSSAPSPTKMGDFAQATKELYSVHSEKLFATLVLVGFTVVFYGGKIEDWCDFWRYVAILPIAILFYLAFILIASLQKKVRRRNK